MKLISALLSSFVLVAIAAAPAQAASSTCGIECELSVSDHPICIFPEACKIKFQLNDLTARDIVAEYRVVSRTASAGRDFDAEATGRVVVKGGTDHAVLAIRTMADKSRDGDREFAVVATKVSSGRVVKDTGLVTIKSTR